MSIPTRITVFSNGLADITKGIFAHKSTKVSLPVRKKHVADVLGSFTVYGKDVTLVSPPSFAPAYMSSVSINPTDTFGGVCDAFRGALVDLNFATPTDSKSLYDATLLGTDLQHENVAGAIVSTRFVTVMASGEMYRIAIKDLRRLFFKQESIRSEILAASNRGQNALDSTNIDFELSAEYDEGKNEPKPAYYQYVIPSAAWKFSYRLRSRGNQLIFEGTAIVDNHTDENWTDVILTVATGTPTTFETDLDRIREPIRQLRTVANNDCAAGAEVESMSLGFAEFESAAPSRSMMRSAGMSKGITGQSIMACSASVGAPPPAQLQSASVVETTTEKVADAVRFTSALPVNIPSRKSASVSMFTATLFESKMVLYALSNDERKIYRAVMFKNENNFSLVRGVCSVYEKENYVGSAILTPTRPGEKQLVTYALDSGVKISSIFDKPKIEITSHNVADSIFEYTEEITRKKTYTIKCDHDEPQMLVIDYAVDERLQLETTFDAENVVGEKIGLGFRYILQLEPKNEHQFVVYETEKKVEQSRITVDNFDRVIMQSKRISTLDEFADCVRINREIKKLRKEVEEKNTRLQQLEKKRTDYLAMVKQAGDDSKLKYQAKLDAVLEECEKIVDVELVELNQRIDEKIGFLREAISGLTVKV